MDVTDAGRDLAGWANFASAHLVNGPKYNATHQLQLFRSRWRIAWNFKGFNVAGFSDATVDAYSAAFKVFLAYSAHEVLATSIGQEHTKFPYENLDLSEKVRKNLCSLKALTLECAKGKQSELLTAFWNGDANDLRPFAYGVRNVVAHGPFTGNRIKTKKARSTLLEVAEYVLGVSEDWFVEWAELVDAELKSISD